MRVEFCGATWWKLRGLPVATVKLDRETQDFTHLIRKEVIVDGTPYFCVGVERALHHPPWRAGEPIGLLLDKVGRVSASGAKIS